MQQTSGRGRERGTTQSTIAHMASERFFVKFVTEVPFVSTRNRNTLVLSVIRGRQKRFTSGRSAHMARKSDFVPCGGSGICEHKKNKFKCAHAQCNEGKVYIPKKCEHGKEE